jgi:hypothetical protein
MTSWLHLTLCSTVVQVMDLQISVQYKSSKTLARSTTAYSAPDNKSDVVVAGQQIRVFVFCMTAHRDTSGGPRIIFFGRHTV